MKEQMRVQRAPGSEVPEVPGNGQGEDSAPLDGAAEAWQVAQTTQSVSREERGPQETSFQVRMNALEMFAPLL